MGEDGNGSMDGWMDGERNSMDGWMGWDVSVLLANENENESARRKSAMQEQTRDFKKAQKKTSTYIYI